MLKPETRNQKPETINQEIKLTMTTITLNLDDMSKADQKKYGPKAITAPVAEQKPDTIRVFKRNNVPANAPESIPTLFCKVVIQCDRDYAKGELIVTGGNGWRSNGTDGASVANFKVETRESRDARRGAADGVRYAYEAKAGVSTEEVPF